MAFSNPGSSSSFFGGKKNISCNNSSDKIVQNMGAIISYFIVDLRAKKIRRKRIYCM
jgi:hypothetical protein